jgi:hypothetical protein
MVKGLFTIAKFNKKNYINKIKRKKMRADASFLHLRAFLCHSVFTITLINGVVTGKSDNSVAPPEL